MMRPDLMVCWIKHCDYPIFRRFLRRYRAFFGKIIIYFSEHFRHMYYDKFIEKDLSILGNIQFLPNIEYKYGVEDWRDIATNHMLKFTNSEWICSVEQDWFCRDWDKFLSKMNDAMKTSDLIGFWQASDTNQKFRGYIHPACWFIKRSILDQTSKDFSAHPEVNGCDHFGMITRDVEKLGGKIVKLEDLGFKIGVWSDTDAYHQGGINQNYLEGLKPEYVFHRAELFYIYNWYSLKEDTVTYSNEFMELMKKIDIKLSDKRFLFENPETSKWAIFYK